MLKVVKQETDTERESLFLRLARGRERDGLQDEGKRTPAGDIETRNKVSHEFTHA